MASQYALFPEIKIDVLATTAVLQDSGLDDGRITDALVRFGVARDEATRAIRTLHDQRRSGWLRRVVMPLATLLHVLRF